MPKNGIARFNNNIIRIKCKTLTLQHYTTALFLVYFLESWKKISKGSGQASQDPSPRFTVLPVDWLSLYFDWLNTPEQDHQEPLVQGELENREAGRS